MNITKNQIDNLNATIKIELGKEDYAERVEKALKDYQKKVVVKGFRPGKTPMGMVKRMYGQSLLFEEINKILGEALGNYIKENNLNILGEPLPNETEQKPLNLEDEHFEFLYDIALAPEVNVKMSKREKLPYYKIKVDDEMIDKQIEAICKNNGSLTPVDVIEGGEYLKGELIELGENGEVKEGGIHNEDASMSLHYMKDEEAVETFKGKKVGEEVKFNAAKAFPNKTDYAALLGVSKEEAEKAGENYCFIIREIKRYVDAEVNEELFTKLFGKDVVKDVAAFRERVKEDIGHQLKGHADYRFTIDAKEKMIKKNEDVVLPEAFLKRWIVAVNENMTPEEVEKDFEGYRDEFKWQLVKSAVVKDYQVKVEDEDLKKEGRQIAAAQLQQYGLFGLTDEQLDGFAAKLLEDDKQRQHLYERAMDEKVFNVIRENMKLEEQEISMADFEKLFQK
ncbi:MAG TPA: trigger factor [Candidatus Odoribacter faecigallinarum]|uniref:Trigger factor n=1 Tax=Candidatus Odoribacter faecigallinarum TaxID=2838706 RepID=A0A9D1UY19_9BACT|nr:trigger factor [Candidatus Odoribacter faecigallinarum]